MVRSYMPSAEHTERKYGKPPVQITIPDVSVGDEVKITVDGSVGIISEIKGETIALLMMEDGTSRMVPLGYLEKV